MQLLTILFVLLLLYLTYHDWKSRSVYWVVFPLLFGLNLYLNSNNDNLFFTYLQNMFIVLLQVASILVYLKIKGYKPSELFSKYFGLGDVLFLGVLGLSFTTEHFLLFNIFSLIGAIGLSLILKLKTIPFAGIQSALLSGYILYNNFLSW